MGLGMGVVCVFESWKEVSVNIGYDTKRICSVR